MADMSSPSIRSWQDCPASYGSPQFLTAVQAQEAELARKVADMGLEMTLACTAIRLEKQRLSGPEWCACAEFVRRHRAESVALARARDLKAAGDEAHLRRVIQLQGRAREMRKSEDTPLVKGGQGRAADDLAVAAVIVFGCLAAAAVTVLCLLGA